MRLQHRLPLMLALALALFLAPRLAHAMHIADGVLTPAHSLLWFALAVPAVLWGMRRVDQLKKRQPQAAAVLGLTGAVVLLVSCVPLPVPLIGTTSHPCGTGLAALVVGLPGTALLTSVVLTLHALFLGHGGLTTLGAGVVSMGLVGPAVALGAFCGLRRLGVPSVARAFVAGLLADWATYSMTAFQLAFALHGDRPLASVFAATLAAFAPTQLIIGVLEGALTASAYAFVQSRRPELLGVGGEFPEGA